jgi:hypothetical protein
MYPGVKSQLLIPKKVQKKLSPRINWPEKQFCYGFKKQF